MPYKHLYSLILIFGFITNSLFAAPFYSNVKKFPIGYQANNNNHLNDVELWYRSPDKKNWTPYGKFNKGENSIIFKANLDGEYQFYTVASDKSGLRETRPGHESKAQQTVIVDSQPPNLKLLEPLGGYIEPGKFVEIKWQVTDDNIEEDGITIELSTADGGWEPLIANTSSLRQTYRWNIAGSLKGQKKFLRISALDKAGNLTSVETAEPIYFTKQPPKIVKVTKDKPKESNVAGPELSNRRIFDINYHIGKTGPSGLGKIGLWYTTNNGQVWNFYAYDTDLKSPIQFSAPEEGIYGFAIELTNRAGISSGQPKNGQKPILSTSVDYTPPSILLINPSAGNFIKGNQEIPITWQAHDRYLNKKPISIYLSVDGGDSWKTLVKNLKNTGTWIWKTPKANSDKFRIKIEAIDNAGNIGSASTTGNFVIDSTTPQGDICKIAPLTKATFGNTKNINCNSNFKTTNNTKNTLQNEHAFKLATIWRNRGNYRKALEYYQQISKQYNNDERFINDVAITYFKAKAYSKALQLFSSLVKQHKNTAKYYYHIGVIHYYRMRYDEAIFYFNKALKLDVNNENSHWYLAKIYYAQKDISGAILEWKQIIKINRPNSLILKQAKILINRYSN